ncbi:MAG: hypothetical protein IAE81_02330 [Caldilineaceae bacterium]|jgi:polyhydroxyalkanoate synthesis regulator phasin|nr:hypothetical protein [Caldilineaceae bacterium]
MTEQQRPELREQLNEMAINARNELIVQAATLFMLGQKVMHLGLGAMALSKDEAAELVTRMIERGEIAEADIQKNVNEMVERVRARGEASDAELQDFAQKATVVLKENVRTILEQVHLPGGASVDALLKQTLGGQSKASDAPPAVEPAEKPEQRKA